MFPIDIVTVFHNNVNRRQAFELAEALAGMDVSLTIMDNSVKNRGFARACNLGTQEGDAPIIGFLNPDVQILGDFVTPVVNMLTKNIVITGNRFGKAQRELRIWGCKDWVCGATFFVTRDFFQERGGFDTQFVWGWEETDLIRQAQVCGKLVVSQELPLAHRSPDVDTRKDERYKRFHFSNGAELFYKKWGRDRVR